MSSTTLRTISSTASEGAAAVANLLGMGGRPQAPEPLECPICLEAIASYPVVGARCGHALCRPCMALHRHSGSRGDFCPICRAPLLPTPPAAGHDGANANRPLPDGTPFSFLAAVRFLAKKGFVFCCGHLAAAPFSRIYASSVTGMSSLGPASPFQPRFDGWTYQQSLRALVRSPEGWCGLFRGWHLAAAADISRLVGKSLRRGLGQDRRKYKTLSVASFLLSRYLQYRYLCSIIFIPSSDGGTEAAAAADKTRTSTSSSSSASTSWTKVGFVLVAAFMPSLPARYRYIASGGEMGIWQSCTMLPEEAPLRAGESRHKGLLSYLNWAPIILFYVNQANKLGRQVGEGVLNLPALVYAAFSTHASAQGSGGGGSMPDGDPSGDGGDGRSRDDGGNGPPTIAKALVYDNTASWD